MKVDENKVKDAVDQFEDKDKLKDGAKTFLKNRKDITAVFNNLCRRCKMISIKCVKAGKAEDALLQYCPRCKKMVENLQ